MASLVCGKYTDDLPSNFPEYNHPPYLGLGAALSTDWPGSDSELHLLPLTFVCVLRVCTVVYCTVVYCTVPLVFNFRTIEQATSFHCFP